MTAAGAQNNQPGDYVRIKTGACSAAETFKLVYFYPKIFEICCLTFGSFVRATCSLEMLFTFFHSHRPDRP